MKILRWMAGVVPLLLTGLFALPLPAQTAKAQSKPQSKPVKVESALAFHVLARFVYHDAEDGEAPEDSLDAKVLAEGQKARVETKIGGRPLVMIFAPPFFYKLLPASKSGTRYRLSDVSKNGALSGFSPQPWLRDPTAIRAALRKQGAVRAADTMLDGVPVELWNAQKFMGMSGQVKAWLRRADALPLRLEIATKTLTATATWRDYQPVRAVSGTPFSPPAGFRIRDGQSSE